MDRAKSSRTITDRNVWSIDIVSNGLLTNRESSNRQRIIFVNRFFYPDISATSQMLHDLTRRLALHHYEVHVVCSRQLYGDAKAQLACNEVVDGVHVHRAAGSRFGRDRLMGRALDYASFYFGAFLELRSLIRAGDIVVAKTDPPLVSVPVSILSRWRRAHLINWLQDVFPEVAQHLGGHAIPGFMASLLAWLRNKSLNSAAMNVVIGQRMKEHIIGCGIDPQSVTVIENWSDSEFISPMPASASELRAQLGLQEKVVVGYSGNMGRAHEYETILNAATALRDDKEVCFLMIGGGVGMQQLKAAVANAGLENFIFLPYQPREMLGDSMAAADIHLISLLPTLEGLIVPSKFYGILAAGRPTIAIGDEDGEIARVVKREQCGTAVLVGDHDMLKNEIMRLKANNDVLSAMGSKAHVLFKTCYTADHAAALWKDVLIKLMGSKLSEHVPVAMTI